MSQFKKTKQEIGIDFLIWRRTRKMSQGEAAELFGVVRQTIASWEQGHVPTDIYERWQQVDLYLKEIHARAA